MVENDPIVIIDSLQLEYATPSSQPLQVSKASDLSSNARYFSHDLPLKYNGSIILRFNLISLQSSLKQPLC